MKAAAVLLLAAALAMGAGHMGHASGGRMHRYALSQLGGNTVQMQCLDALWTRESAWRPDAVNPGTGAYGIPQANPAVWGHPYSTGDWQAQIRWGLAYIAHRYGSPCAAEAHEQTDNWY